MAARKKVSAKEATMKIQRSDYRTVVFDVQGTGDLMVSQWSIKAKTQIAEKQAGGPKVAKRAPRDPEAEFQASMYRDSKGRHLFPTSAFRKAAISACRTIDGLPMTLAKQLFWCPDEFVVLELKDEPFMDVRPVRLQSGTSDLRYRARYSNWKTKLRVRYNASAVSLEQIAILLDKAGEEVGIGEYRIERTGFLGTFRIGTVASKRKKAA